MALCYTGDLSDPGERLYTLAYYLRLAEQIVAAGAHIITVKDMAGLLRHAPWCPRYGRGSIYRFTCTPMTRPAGNWRR